MRMIAKLLALAAILSQYNAFGFVIESGVEISAFDQNIGRELFRQRAEQFLASSQGINKKKDCLSSEQIPQEYLERLDEEDLELLPHICWPRDLQQNLKKSNLRYPQRGIPEGVKCNVTKWCDEENNCSEVCKRGTVQLSKWLQNALKTQWAINRKQPLCNAVLPGTHNSGITLADGYGNLDQQFQDYFRWISWVADDAQLRTNDQIFSLTDQLNLGIRNVELDTHEVEGKLRIAHCGGYHGDLNVLVQAVNIVAKLLGHPIHWDTETIGCNPSLSSIPVLKQRTFSSAIQEISEWMDKNPHEFLILYLDDQPDLLDWGAIPELMAEIEQYFPLETIFTPKELASQFNGSWPSVDTLSAKGKKIIVVTGWDYGPMIDSMMFSKEGRHTVCGWSEPDFKLFTPPPDCLANADPLTGKTLNGTLFRQLTCELYYGPMNCNFHWSNNNDPLLDENSLPDVYKCGVNSPSPDSLSPRRASSMIWNWAPNHPYPDKLENSGENLWDFSDNLNRVSKFLPKSLAKGFLDTEKECATLDAIDGRWRKASCTAKIPVACKFGNGTWAVKDRPCPDGALFSLPSGPKDNTLLAEIIKNKYDSVLINIQGPKWEVPDSPLWSQ